MKTKYKVSAVAVLALGAAFTFAGGWKASSSPSMLNSNYNPNFASLPLEGRVGGGHTPWSDTYWPNSQGGIAYRWNHPNPQPFRYQILNEAAVRSMSPEQIAQLSPAEKFDIVRGRFDFPLTRWVLKSNSPDAPSWHGMCHGWAPGAINHPEPAPKTVVANGVTIPFGSSDVKALISYYYGSQAYGQRQVRQLGRRCNGGGIFNRRSCRDDVNAGAFHIVLANQLGLMNEGLVADVSEGRQVWNQPVVGFTSRIVGERGASRKSAPGTVKEIRLQTRMDYTVEIGAKWDPVVGTSSQAERSKHFDYWLELNSAGNIIGGSYESGSAETPDFLWTVKPMQFTGDFSALNDIYDPITH